MRLRLLGFAWVVNNGERCAKKKMKNKLLQFEPFLAGSANNSTNGGSRNLNMNNRISNANANNGFRLIVSFFAKLYEPGTCQNSDLVTGVSKLLKALVKNDPA